MKTLHFFLIFLVLALIQLAIPAKMILDKESVLKNGKVYKFKTRPVDPNDPFRGKYIALHYDINSAKTQDTSLTRGDKIYVYIEDSLGYAKLNTISKTKLKSDMDYVEAQVQWTSLRDGTVNFDLPFDRFYMDELKAKPAEIAYNESHRQSKKVKKPTYAEIAIESEKAVLKNVFIENIPVIDYVKERAEH